MRKYFDRLRKIDSHVHLMDKSLQKKSTIKPFLEDTFIRYHSGDVVESSKARRIVKSLVFSLLSAALSTKRANRMVLSVIRLILVLNLEK